MMMMNNNSNIKTLSTSPMPHNHHFERSRSRLRPWRRSRIGTAAVAVAALLLSTTAWLSLVFSGTTTNCWHRFKNWEASPHSSLRWAWNNQSFVSSSPPPPPPPTQSRNRSLSEKEKRDEEEELSLKHIVFGIAGSSQLWTRRKEFVKLWWRPAEMRGHVWLEEEAEEAAAAADNGSLLLLPPVMVSEDISRFRYTNPTGHPSGLRISRIITECFRLGLPTARWYVLGDDDTIFNVDNLVALLHKYDPSQMVYIGSSSESHSANTYFSHSMAFGGGGIAISHPLAEALSSILDDCLDRYPKLYGSDDRLHACISELGVPLTREPGFHQVSILNSHFICSTSISWILKIEIETS